MHIAEIFFETYSNSNLLVMMIDIDTLLAWEQLTKELSPKK